MSLPLPWPHNQRTYSHFLGDTTMGNDKQSPATTVEQLVNQQFELMKTVRDRRKELRDVEQKNRELKAQIATALNLPKGVSIVVKRAQG